jgi:hypothetical protein
VAAGPHFCNDIFGGLILGHFSALAFGSLFRRPKVFPQIDDPTKSGILPEAPLDARTHSEGTVRSPDAASAEDARRLRRIKAESPPPKAGDATPSGRGLAPPATETLPFEDRRKSPRLHCSGSVEFQVAGREVLMWGTLTDISLHGCYVEMKDTFPVGAQVHLVLKSCGGRVESRGQVRTSYPALGMGISFTDIDRKQQGQLQQLLAMLAGHSSTGKVEPAKETVIVLKDSPRLAKPRALFDELSEFFRKRETLSLEEFIEIANRTRGF